MLKKLCVILLIAALALSLLPAVTAQDTPEVSNNIGQQDYAIAASTVKSYLSAQPDGSFLRIEAIDDHVAVETYASDFSFTSSLTFNNELPLFGGFYESPDSFFLVFGQQNFSEDDKMEVVRVVRYDKNWKRLAAASVYGSNTRLPFSGGSLRMTHCGDMLYIRTCHQMYRFPDGLIHQANLMLAVKISEMKLTDRFCEVGNISSGYVSHSLNQFILADGDRLVALDHGDAYPRSIVLLRYGAKAGSEIFIDDNNRCSFVNILPISGDVGKTETGAGIGGLEASEAAYLVAGNTVDQKNGDNAGVRNIFVSVTPKDSFSEADSELVPITDYPETDSSYLGQVSTPHLVKTEDAFVLLWTAKGKLCYVLLGQNGKPATKIMTADVPLSGCKPIYAGNSLYWYCTENSAPVFYSMDLTSPEDITVISDDGSDTGDVTLPIDPFDPTEPTEPPEPTEPTEPPHEEVCPSRGFTDVPGIGAWEHAGIDYVVQNKLFNGVSTTKFAPDLPMTRAMLVTVLWRAVGQPKQGSNPFSDVPENEWYTDAVKWASACNIVNGVSRNRFEPETEITREQMVTILYRFAQYQKMDVSASASLTQYADFGKTGAWALDAMRWAAAKGIITGSNENGKLLLLPQDSATRAQVAAILMRFFKGVNA